MRTWGSSCSPSAAYSLLPGVASFGSRRNTPQWGLVLLLLSRFAGLHHTAVLYHLVCGSCESRAPASGRRSNCATGTRTEIPYQWRGDRPSRSAFDAPPPMSYGAYLDPLLSGGL